MLKQMESIAVPERSEEETQELQRDEVCGSKLSIRNSASLKGRIFLTICQFSDNSQNSIFAKSKSFIIQMNCVDIFIFNNPN